MATKNEDKKFAVYTRKSRFTGKGESISHQKKQCIDKIMSSNNNIDMDNIVFFEDEGFSGKNVKRPGFQKMKAMIENDEITAVYVYSLDRLSRSISDFSSFYKLLKKHDVNFVTVNVTFETGSIGGEAMLNMLAVFSEFERNLIAERIRDNMHELAKSGRWLGGTAPTGFKSKEIVGSYAQNGKERKAFMLEPIEDEVAIVQTIYDKYVEFSSQSKLITYLMNEGYKTKNDVFFTRLAIKAILTNPVYTVADESTYEYFSSLGANICAAKEEFNGRYGIMAYNKTEQIDGKAHKKNDYSEWIIAVGKHAPIISSEQWLKAQEILNYRGKQTKRYPRTEVALLSGLLFCGKCGKHMRPKLGAVKKNGNRQFVYRCTLKDDSKKQLCDARNINGYEIDSMVLQEIFNLVEKFKTKTADVSALRKTIDKPDFDFDAEIKRLTKKVSEINTTIRNATNQLTACDINNEDDLLFINLYKTQIKNSNAEKIKHEDRIKNLQVEKAKQDHHLSDLNSLIDSLISFTDDYPNMTYDERLKTIRSIVDFVIFHEDSDSVEVIFKGSGKTREEYLESINPTGMYCK